MHRQRMPVSYTHLRIFCDDDFKGFERRGGRKQVNYVCMAEYDATMPNCEVAYPPVELKLSLIHILGAKDVYLHCITDGRDTDPHSGKGFLADLQAKLDELGVGKIASVSGRYYAMDRDVYKRQCGRRVRSPAQGYPASACRH